MIRSLIRNSSLPIMEKVSLLKLNNMVKLVVTNRPSKTVRSPYMCDVLYNGKSYFAHCPSLSCCGFISAARQVWAENKMLDETKKNSEAKTQFGIHLGIAQDSGVQVGTNPVLGNKLAKIIMQEKLIDLGCDYQPEEIKGEVTFGISRFDFVLGDKNIVEVKYVPIAMHEDVDWLDYQPQKYKKLDPTKKIAIFPVGEKGMKVLKGAPVSQRACKHINHMGDLVKKKQVNSATLLFVVTRGDVKRFKISNQDKQYQEAVRGAVEKGVKVRAVRIRWENCEAFFDGELDVEI